MSESIAGFNVDLKLQEGDMVTGLVVLAYVQDPADDAGRSITFVPDGVNPALVDGMLFRAYHMRVNGIEAGDDL